MIKVVEGELMPPEQDQKTEYEKYWSAENQEERLKDISWWHND